MPKLYQFSPKHPGSKLDYIFDFAAEQNNNGLEDWLEPAETLSGTPLVEATGGIVISGVEFINSNTAVLVYLASGIDEEDYEITCTCETSNPPKVVAKTAILPVRVTGE